MTADQASLPTKPFDGLAWRLIRRRHADNPLSTVGSEKRNGRYHVQKAYPILYFGLSPDVCVAEVEHAYSGGLPRKPASIEAHDLWEYNVTCMRVVNLTVAATLKHLGVNTADLINNDHAATQPLGQRLYDDAQQPQALLAPSARHSNGYCLDVWMDRLNDNASTVKAVKRTARYWPTLAPA
jgi:RES domain-containing protein